MNPSDHTAPAAPDHSALYLAIEETVAKAKAHRRYLAGNERATEATLIQPILDALGWEGRDPSRVRQNETTAQGRPDYTLYLHDQAIAHVEAKYLGHRFSEKEITQLARYCFNSGAKYGVLTDGMRWHLYRAYEEGTVFSDRLSMHIDLANEGHSEAGRKLHCWSFDTIQNLDALLQKEKERTVVATALGLDAAEDDVHAPVRRTVEPSNRSNASTVQLPEIQHHVPRFTRADIERIVLSRLGRRPDLVRNRYVCVGSHEVGIMWLVRELLHHAKSENPALPFTPDDVKFNTNQGASFLESLGLKS